MTKTLYIFLLIGLAACNKSDFVSDPLSNGSDPTPDDVYLGLFDFHEFADGLPCKAPGLPTLMEIVKANDGRYQIKFDQLTFLMTVSGEFPYLLFGETQYNSDDYALQVRYLPSDDIYEMSLLHRTNSDLFCSRAEYIKRN